MDILGSLVPSIHHGGTFDHVLSQLVDANTTNNSAATCLPAVMTFAVCELENGCL